MNPRWKIVVKLWSSDLTNSEIGARAGYTGTATLHYIARRLGLPPRKRGAKPQRLTEAQRIALDYGRQIANTRQRRKELRSSVVDPVARIWRCPGCNGVADNPAGHPGCVHAGRAA